MDRPRAAARGETIQVQQGDTLYGISKRYGVSISALIEVNGLAHGSAIKPGQQLVLPAGVHRRQAPRRSSRAGRAPLARDAIRAAAGRRTDGDGRLGGTPHLKAGESLYSIARQHGVTLAELQRVNGITEPTRVRAGTVLSVPGTRRAPSRAVAERTPAAAPRAAQGTPAPPASRACINAPGEQKTAALGDRSNDATAPAAEPRRRGRRRVPLAGPRARSSPRSASAPTAPTTTASTSPCRRAPRCTPPRADASPTPATSSRATATWC